MELQKNLSNKDGDEFHFFDFDEPSLIEVTSSKIEKSKTTPIQSEITPILGRYSKGKKKNQYYYRGYSSTIKIPDKNKTEIMIFTNDYEKTQRLVDEFSENIKLINELNKNKNELLESGIIYKHKFTKDVIASKMMKNCLRKNNEALQVMHNANVKIKGKVNDYIKKCNKNGYKEKELLKAMEILKKPININKTSNIHALSIFYAHICNDKSFLDHVASKKEDMEIILKNCIEFCKTFEELEVCSIYQDVLSIKIKADISSLLMFENVPKMLKDFEQTAKYLKMEKERDQAG